MKMLEKYEETKNLFKVLEVMSESGVETKCPDGYIYAVLCDIAKSLARITDVLEKRGR